MTHFNDLKITISVRGTYLLSWAMTVTRGAIIANYQHSTHQYETTQLPSDILRSHTETFISKVYSSNFVYNSSVVRFLAKIKIYVCYATATTGFRAMEISHCSVILVVVGYIQFAVNIVIPRHHHRLLGPNKWTKKPLISVRSKMTQTINLILYQIALTIIFDDNHQLWSKSSSLIFSVERFREARQAFSTLFILNKDTYFFTHTSALRGIRWFVTARKLSPQITTSKSVSYELFFSFFVHSYSFFSYKHIWVKYVIFRKNNKGLTMSGTWPRASPLDGKGSE